MPELARQVTHPVVFLRLAALELRRIAEDAPELAAELRHIARKLDEEAADLACAADD